MDEPFPNLIPITGSENVRKLLTPQKLVGLVKDDDSDALPIEFKVHVLFNKAVSEKFLSEPLMPLMKRSQQPIKPSDLDTKFCGKVAAIGITASTEQFALFVENSSSSSKKRKVVKPKLFKEVIFWASLISATVHSDDFDLEEEEEEEEEEAQSDQPKTENKNISSNDNEVEAQEPYIEPELLTEHDLKLFVTELKQCIAQVDKTAKVILPESIEHAAKRAEKLAMMVEACDEVCDIILELPPSNEGNALKIYDVMLSLGFEFDSKAKQFIFMADEFTAVFHALSGDVHQGFDAMTISQNPHFGSLIFRTFVPHLPRPIDTGRALSKAAKYAHSKLGGKLLSESGNTFDENNFLGEIKKITKKMAECGIKPGSDYACTIF